MKEAKIQAFKAPLLKMRFCGGFVPGQDDVKLRHRRGNMPHDSYEESAVYPNWMAGSFIYGGPVHDHFGHFMAEMVHRIVPSRLMYGAVPFIFVTEAGDKAIRSVDDLPGFVRSVFELFGIGGDVRFIAENTIVEQLFVAEQGSEWRLGPKPGYLDDLREYVTPRLDALYRGEERPKKVYVSRSKMLGGFFLGERYLESQLAEEGFSTVYPETLPVSVQMDIYRKADVVVFAEGSACHGVELLGSGALRRCYVIARRKGVFPVIEKVLQPRSSAFATSAGHTFLGTAFVGRKSEPSRRLGVTLLNAEALLAFCRTNGIARLPHFSEKLYLDAAESDWAVRSMFPGRTIAKYRRGAERDLLEAFHRHIVTAWRPGAVSE